MESSSSNKYNKVFKGKISFSGLVRFFSIIILIYIMDYFLSSKDIAEPLKWKLIIIWGGVEILFFFSITKLINLLININKKIDSRY